MNEEIITLKDARHRGLRYYYTGKPCHRGHIAQRKVIGRICVVCDADKQAIVIMNRER